MADRGYEGATLREITTVAGVELALVNYHFESKERLYVSVLSRRNAAINARRLACLDEARREAHPGPIPLEVIVDSFLSPLFERMTATAPGWRNWGKIAARLNMAPPVQRHIREEIDTVSQAFIAELRRALPHVRPGALFFRYTFLVSVVLEVLHGTGRVFDLSGGTEDMRNIPQASAEAKAFIMGALQAP